MKILFMTTRLDYSGAPKMMAWVANQMAEKGYDVHFVTFYSEEQARLLHEKISVTTLKVRQSSSRFVRNTVGMVKNLFTLHKTVRRIQPDVVVSFLDSMGYTYLPVGRLLTKAKFIVSERSDPYTRHGTAWAVRKFLMKFAHGTVFQTQGAQSYFEKQKQIYDRSVVIPNPVVLSDHILAMRQRIPSFEQRDKRIVTVGRLSLRQKRQDVLLDAFCIFHEKHPEYELVIYGGGSDEEKIRAMIHERGLDDCVFLMGPISNVEDKIFFAAGFVISSDYEGIPNALIEAMSIGVPSVSTDCSPGGAALLIQDGENGFLVPRGDAMAIAEKLSSLVTDKEVTERFSENGPTITETFAEPIIAEAWEAFFKKTNGAKGWSLC